MDLHLLKGLKNVIFPPKVSLTHKTSLAVLYNMGHIIWLINLSHTVLDIISMIFDSGDLVVGVVTHKHPEYYRVDINAPELATLR